MKLTSMIRFGPVFTAERHNDPRWNKAGRTFYESLALVPVADGTAVR